MDKIYLIFENYGCDEYSGDCKYPNGYKLTEKEAKKYVENETLYFFMAKDLIKKISKKWDQYKGNDSYDDFIKNILDNENNNVTKFIEYHEHGFPHIENHLDDTQPFLYEELNLL